MTRISVILPVHNARPFLPFCLASLLEQSHRDIRIIAIDDGSTDGSDRILSAAAALDPRVTVVSRGNRGLIATLNEGLALADTDLVARMDADDIAFPDRFRAQLEFFAAQPDVGLLGTNFTTIYTPLRVSAAADPILTKPGERAILGRFCTPLRHPTAMFRRSAIAGDELFYDPAYPYAEDFDLFRRLAGTTAIAETAAPYLAYRIHPGSVSATRSLQMVQTHLRILEENLTRYYPQAAGTGVERIAVYPDGASVDAAADLIRSLDALALQQPESERNAYEIGVRNTLHFLFSLLYRRGEYGLAHRLVARSESWHLIRRRERAVLQTPLAPAGMAFSEWLVGFQRWRGSRLLVNDLPGYPAIADHAQKIERAAGATQARHAG